MKINNITAIVISSLLSAIVVAIIFSQFIIPPIKKSAIDGYALKASDIVLSDKAKRIFESATPTDFTIAAKRSMPSIVFIESENKIENDSYFTRTVTHQTGSGVIVDSDGLIVTNYHVIEGAHRITVTLGDKREFIAEVKGYDKQTDLAVIQIEEKNLPTLNLGNSDNLKIGEWVLAIGNPYRLHSTVTAGIVSAKGRNIRILEDSGIESFIQTDAAVNSGNSGGALVNTNGELIGINTAIISSSGGYQGFSFAIPINIVRKVIKDIKEYGAVQRAWLGVTIEDVNDAIAKDLNLPNVKGVKIVSTIYGGGAQEAGLITNDVILSVNNQPTPAMSAFVEQLGKLRPGNKVIIKYIRDGKTAYANAVLRNQLNSTDLVAVRKDKVLLDLGFELRDLDQREVDRLVQDGVYVVSIYQNSKVSDANMEPGYIITSINDKKVEDIQSFIDYLTGYHGEVTINGIYEKYEGNFPYKFTIE